MDHLKQIIDDYNRHADEYLERYESIAFEDIHPELLPFLTPKIRHVLDVGSGSGRDAAYFANRGYEVVAVEPSSQLREGAMKLHPERNILWLDDSLPRLSLVHGLGIRFDLILLSAVWMHLQEDIREEAFSCLIKLLADKGLLTISVRLGPGEHNRCFYSVSMTEVKELGISQRLDLLLERMNNDSLGRDEIRWQKFIFRK